MGVDSPREGGSGLVGMRERVALFRGELEAEGRPEGGFAVRARLPLTGVKP
jgi:signal transduction histidine kinase